MLLFLMLACSTDQEAITKKVLASAEIQELIQDREALKKEIATIKAQSEDVDNLKGMAKCLSKVYQRSRHHSFNSSQLKKCGRIGLSTEEREAYEKKLKERE